ncbi:DUF6263 family protein [Natronospora cellulosivora (SeqCode)]
MKKSLVLLLAVSMFLTVSLISIAETSYELYFDLQEGAVYNIDMVTNTHMSQNIFGQSVDMDQVMTVKYLYSIEEITSDNIYIIEMKFLDMENLYTEFDVSGPEDIDLESLNEELDYFNDILIDQTIQMHMDRYGNVIDVKGFDDYMMEMYLYLLENEEDPEALLAFQNFTGQFNDEVIKQSFQGYNSFMPDKAVSIGETWMSNIELALEFPIVLETKYTLENVTDDEFIISYEGSMDDFSDLMSMFGLDELGMDFVFDFDTTYTGVVHLDRDTRWYNSMEMKMVMDGRMIMIVPLDDAGNTQEIIIPMNTNSEFTLISY